MVYRAYVNRGAAGESGGSSGNGELIPANGSKRAVTVVSRETGKVYQLGLQEITPGYVGKPFQYMTMVGGTPERFPGRLFIDYLGTGTYSPPFRGIGDLDGSAAVPPKEGGRIFEIAGYPSDYEDCFTYDWDAATFGGSNIYDMIIKDLREGFPKVLIGVAVTGGFNLVGVEDTFYYWGISYRLNFPFTYRDDPNFSLIAYQDGLFDYYKPYVLDRLDAQSQLMVNIFMQRKKGWSSEITTGITRRGFGFGVQTGEQYFNPGVSGFANLGTPDVRLFVLPDGRVTIATDSPAAYPNPGYVNSAGWPLLRYDISSYAGTVDELGAHSISGGGHKWYRRKGGYCFG